MITTVKTSSVIQGMPKYRSMLAGNPAYTPPSFESIATATGTGSSGTITFSSIPSTFKHLQIRGIFKDAYTLAAGTTSIYLRYNSDTSAVYTYHNLIGNGSTASASASVNITETEILSVIPTSHSTLSNVMGVVIIDLLDYASTTKFKTLRAIGGVDANLANTDYTVGVHSGLWRSTSVISSISISSNYSNVFTTSSTFALYGIKEF